MLRRTLFLAAAALLTSTPAFADATDAKFTIAVLPDTQNYMDYTHQRDEKFPFDAREMFFDQMEYIAAKVESEAGKLVEIGAGVAGGALEIASLGEAFGMAVKLFADSSDKMMATLQRIEGALAKSLTRSDEQLAYYVAQAREIIDLSILSQKKMVDDLQRVAASQGEA